MSKALTYGGPVLVILIAIGLGWHYMNPKVPAPAATQGLDGYPMVCTECQNFFVIPLDKIQGYPADPSGAGFKCPKCNKLAAKQATQCQKCKQWYVALARGMPCPRCKQ